MDDNSKIRIEAKDGLALIGSAFHVLEDKTASTFKTDSLEFFIQKTQEINSTLTGCSVYYQDSSIQIIQNQIDRYSVPLLECNLSLSDALNRLIKNIGRKQSRDDFEEFLVSMKPYLMDDSRFLLSQVRDFSLNKVTSMNRKKEKNGDYLYHYVTESTGKDDFDPPVIVPFRIPIFKGVESEMVINFDFDFNYRQAGDEILLTFCLRFPDFDEYISKIMRDILSEALECISLPKYYGVLDMVKMSDDWKYKENTIKL